MKKNRIKEAALAYAAEGWPVLACYTNTRDGCSCGDTQCLSPGKHPHPKYSPNGVNSATTDLDEIARWPRKINIGIALGHKNLLALDVDDADVAAALLTPGVVHETGAARTGRGVHIYFLCEGSKKTVHLRDKVSTRKIGHVAGLGAYCIAPPSISPTGKRYKWLTPTRQSIPKLQKAGDAASFIKRLLKPHGFEPVKTQGISSENVPDDVEVEEHDLQDIHKRLVTDSNMKDIKARLKGAFSQRTEGGRDPEHDLSGWEHHIACEILRAAKGYKVKSLDPLVLAGVLKKLDRVHYGKFESDVETGRRSRVAADRRYLVSAIRAMDAENVRQKSRKTRSDAILTADADDTTGDIEDDEIVGLDGLPTYLWEEDTSGLYYIVRGAKKSRAQKVANFKPKLVAEWMVDKATGQPDRAWTVQFLSMFGTVREVSLKADEFDSTHALERALSRKLSHEYVVAHNGHPHMKPAILELTAPEEIERFSIRAVPGWWHVANEDGDEERVFLLPSALGAISSHGLIPDLRMRVDKLEELEDDIAQAEFSSYGLNIRPPTTAEEKKLAWRALRSAVTCGPYEITMPILMQVMMGPLWNAGADEVPSLLHVSGRTGVLKTSFCQVAMSLLGTFRKTTPPTASWPSASPSALRSILSAARDLTVLVDDYKEGATMDKRGMRELIQAYADKSMRQRLKSSGERRRSLELRAVMLSNGEDKWAREASMVARTIFLDVRDLDIKDVLLKHAQDAVDRGEMQLMGGYFLQWLAGQDKLFEERYVEKLRERWLQRLQKRTQHMEMHRRLLASVSTLAAVGDVFLLFVKECYPKHHEEAKRWVRGSIRTLVFGSKKRAQEVQELSPLRQLLGYLASEMEAGHAALYPLYGASNSYNLPADTPNAEVVGWWGKPKKYRRIYLNASTTFGWYTREMRKQGREVTFSWGAVVQETKDNPLVKELRMRVGRNKRQIRVLSLPLDILDLEEVGTEG